MKIINGFDSVAILLSSRFLSKTWKINSIFDLSGNIWSDLTEEEKELKIVDLSTRFDGLD